MLFCNPFSNEEFLYAEDDYEKLKEEYEKEMRKELLLEFEIDDQEDVLLPFK